MAAFSSWRPCSGCFHFLKRSLPTAGIKDRNLRKRLQKFFRISMLKSSNVPIGSKDLWFCPNAGSSSAPSPVSYTHLRAHETRHDLVCRLLLEKKKKNTKAT